MTFPRPEATTSPVARNKAQEMPGRGTPIFGSPRAQRTRLWPVPQSVSGRLSYVAPRNHNPLNNPDGQRVADQLGGSIPSPYHPKENHAEVQRLWRNHDIGLYHRGGRNQGGGFGYSGRSGGDEHASPQQESIPAYGNVAGGRAGWGASELTNHGIAPQAFDGFAAGQIPPSTTKAFWLSSAIILAPFFCPNGWVKKFQFQKYLYTRGGV